jgi:hypothetical protein
MVVRALVSSPFGETTVRIQTGTLRQDKGMKIRVHPGMLFAALLVFTSVATTPLSAWQAAEPQRIQVVSANPFGLLFELFNAEYERVVSEVSTMGVGGSMFSSEGEMTYLNADLFWRLYPTGSPLNGWAFGGKVGITSVEDAEYFGYGFDVNRSWVVGKQQNFYVGIGFGLKRLVGADDLAIQLIPTIRIVNIGFAF